MKLFRAIFLRKFMAIATGLLVMNMSLFLAEVEALKLLKNGEIRANIYKLWAAAGNEEEKDFSGAEEEPIAKETVLYHHTINDFASTNDGEQLKFLCWATFDTESAYRETLSPPPKS